MIVASLALLFAQTAPAPATPAKPACEGEMFEAFDFWVGEWDVYPANGETLVAHSRIEKLYGGCAVRENWMPLAGGPGGSLSAYNPVRERWHQTWVGSSPGPFFFEGGTVGGKMVLTGAWRGSGPNGEDGLTRMTYSREAGGAVRQHGEFSADYGLTWTTSFDFIYRPRTETTE